MESWMTKEEMEVATIVLNSKVEVIKRTDGGQVRRYFLNGVLRMEAGAKGEFPDGPFVVFYPSGATWIKGSFTAGARDFKQWLIFSPEGEPISARG